jgi:hypothetical protein
MTGLLWYSPQAVKAEVGNDPGSNQETQSISVVLVAVRLPNDFIAIPDAVTSNRIGGLIDQTATTGAELTYSVEPAGASVSSLTAVFTYKKNGKTITYAISPLTGLNQKQIVTLQLGQEDYESETPEQFDVKLTYTVPTSSQSSDSNIITKNAKQLLSNIEFSPQSYWGDTPLCPYTNWQSPMKGSDSNNEWYGLLMTYDLGADLQTLAVQISGGDVGSKTLAVMPEALLAGSSGIHKVKWEGYDYTINEPADTPFCVFPEDITVQPAPYHVVQEGDYQYQDIMANASTDLTQTHEVMQIPILVGYNTTDASQ